MKKLILILAIAFISICSFSQNIGIKLAGVTTLTVTPAYTQNVDSIAIISVDRTYDAVTANLQFWKNGNLKASIPSFVLWNTFQSYADVSDAKIIIRVKNKLNIP